MITGEQFDRSKQFIYQYGRLIDRKRFAYHFEQGDPQGVLDVLACYQNADGGFGHGLELDIACPQSSGICMELALYHLWDLGIGEGDLVSNAITWILSSCKEDGDLPHLSEAVIRYPHGNWWKEDDGKILAIAGLLGKLGIQVPEISTRAAAFFGAKYLPFPEGLGVYSSGLNLYLRFAEGADEFSDCIPQLESGFVAMLEEEAWHYPLFFYGYGWASDAIDAGVWKGEGRKAIASMHEDGGVTIERYKSIVTYPVWRAVWTLDMLVTLKRQKLADFDALSAMLE
jgi:hypothetical protein